MNDVSPKSGRPIKTILYYHEKNKALHLILKFKKKFKIKKLKFEIFFFLSKLVPIVIHSMANFFTGMNLKIQEYWERNTVAVISSLTSIRRISEAFLDKYLFVQYI